MKLPLRDFSEIVATLRGPGEKADSNEKRQAARMTVSAKITAFLLEKGKVKRSYSVLTRDISLSGVGLLQTIGLPGGTEVILELPRPGSALYVCGVVMHCRTLADGLLAVGIEFLRMVDDQLAVQLSKVGSDEMARVQRAIMD